MNTLTPEEQNARDYLVKRYGFDTESVPEHWVKAVAGYAVESRQKWVPVSEWLPEKPSNVLAVNAGKVTPAIYWRGVWFFLSVDKPLKNVTHWMPLPAPPSA